MNQRITAQPQGAVALTLTSVRGGLKDKQGGTRNP
jgi:hypothetical protein